MKNLKQLLGICEHIWEIIEKNNFIRNEKVIYIIYISRCKKCGKLKKFKNN